MTLVPVDVAHELLFADWHQWPEMRDSDGSPWTGVNGLWPELATANRRAAAYQLIGLAQISHSPAFAARYALLARTASRCTDGPMWLRSTATLGTLTERLYAFLTDTERAAFDALTMQIEDSGDDR